MQEEVENRTLTLVVSGTKFTGRLFKAAITKYLDHRKDCLLYTSIIPVQAEYLPAKGLEQLLQTVNKVKRQINPKLQIDGILLTMVDNRTNFSKEIAALLRETYGSKIKVFGTEIPHSVRAKEISAEGKSIFAHDPNGKVAEGYKNLTQEVIKLEKQREKSRAGSIR